MTGQPAAPVRSAPGGARARRRVGILVLLILAAGTALRLPDFTDPWRHTTARLKAKGLNGALYGTIARNHVRHGYLGTRLAMVRCGGERTVEELGNHRYLNHPPLFAVLLSFSFQAFGVHEWSARLVPLLFSVLSLLMLFGVCRLVSGLRPALIAMALMAATPMAAYFGAFVDVQSSPVLFIALVIFYFYWKWYSSRRSGFFLALILSFLIGAALDWPIYLLALALFLHFLLNPGDRGYSRLIVGLPVTATIAFGLTLVHIGLLAPDRSLSGFLDAFRFQGLASSPTFGQGGLWAAWAGRLEVYFLRYYTLPLLFLAAFWMVRALLAGAFRRAPAGGGLVFCFVFTGGAYVLLFPAGSAVHEFWSFYLIPALCASVAFLLSETSRWTAAVATSALAIYLGAAAWALYEPEVPHRSAFYVQAGQGLREKTRPADTVTVIGSRTEAYLYAYYGDRTIHYLDPPAIRTDPEALDRAPGRWVAVVKDIDLYRRRTHPSTSEGYEAVLEAVTRRLGPKAEPVVAGPLLLFPIGAKDRAATASDRSSSP